MDKLKVLGLTLLLAMYAGLVSCSDDKDKDGGFEDFETPKYEEFSAKYEIESSNSEIESIELTASGNYIITKNSYSYYSTYSQKIGRMILAKPAESRSSYTPIYGEYTKISDTEFKLEGFGTIKIDGSTDDAYSLTITETGEEPYVLTASKKTQMEDSGKTNALCRTWNISTLGMKYVINGKTIYEGTESTNNIKQLATSLVDSIIKYYKDIYGEDITEEEDFEESYNEMINEFVDTFNDNKPEQVVFTKSGTYMVYYNAERLGISTWAWEDIEEGILRYSWNYDDMYGDGSGIVNISFSDNKMHITESNSESEDGMTLSISVTWGMTEAK